MANTVIGASVEVEYSSVGNMRKALKEANSELLAMQDQFGSASKQAIQAAKKVADLKDRIQDAREAADLFDPGKKFQAFVTLGSQIAAGFSAVQGAMALVGSESEDLQKALLKVQGAMALAQGLSELKDFGKSWQQLKIFVSNATAGMSSFRKALLATGVGLFVAAIGTLVAYWDDLKDAISGANDITKAYGESQKEVTKAVSDARNKFKEVTTAMELAKEGVISKEEALNKYNEKLGDTFGKTTSLEVAESRIAKYTNTYLKSIELRTRAQVFYGKAAEAAAKAASGEEVDPSIWQTVTDFFAAGGVNANFFAEQAKTTALNIKDLKDKQKQFTDEADRLTKEAIIAENELSTLKQGNNEKEVKDNKEKNNKINKDNRDELNRKKEAAELEKKINEDLAKSKLDERGKELFDLKKTYDEQKKILEDNGKSTVALTELYKSQEAAINKKYDDEEDKRHYELREKLKERNKKNREEDLARQKEYNQQLAEADRALYDAKFAAASAGFELLTVLAGKNEKLANVIFAVEKAVAIAKIVVDTQKEIAGYYAAGAANPINAIIPGAGVAIATKQALAAKIRAGVSIASIIATTIGKYKKGGNASTGPLPTTGGGGGGAQTTAPIAPRLGANATAQALNAEAINNLGNTALRAYVMNSDIQNNSQRNAYLQRNARIG